MQNRKSTGLKTGRYEGDYQTKGKKLLDALDVAGFGSVYANLITFVDEWGNGNYQAGFESCWFHHRAGGGFLDGGLGLRDAQIHGVGKVDTDGFVVVEFHFHD